MDVKHDANFLAKNAKTSTKVPKQVSAKVL